MSEIDVKYQALGGASGFLKNPISLEQTCADGTGRFRIYQGGRIYWTPATGAHEIHGSILRKWLTLGAEQSRLGYPTSDEQFAGAPDDDGRRVSDFQHGAIYWSGPTGTHEMHGAILAKYRALPILERTKLGLPTSDERIAPDGIGRYTEFADGAIYWKRSTGAHTIYGPIYGKWMALGGTRGVLGYPTSDSTGTSTVLGADRFNLFEHGSIYQHGGSAFAVLAEIDQQWAAQDREKGPLGFPVSDELPSGVNARASNFEHGVLKRTLPLQPRTATPPVPTFAYASDLKFDGTPNIVTAHKMHAAQGFRLLSLSMWGSPEDPRYAAVWANDGGPEQKAVFHATEAEYVKFSAQMIDAGLKPTLIAATGAAGKAAFAIVAEERAGIVPVLRHRLTAGPDDDGLYSPETFAYWNQWARGNNHILRCAAIYGDSMSPRYAAIWEHDPHGVAWNVAYHDAQLRLAHNFLPESDPQFLGTDDLAAVIQAQSFWARASFRTQGAGGRQLVVFRDDRLGTTDLRVNLTSKQVQTEAEALKAIPVCVQGTRVNGESRFSAIFASQVRPQPRKLSIKGETVKSLAALDDAVATMLRHSGARNASLAVARDGRLVYARAFTWAESEQAAITPQHTFRIASISKSITAVAVCQLLDAGERGEAFDSHLGVALPGKAAGFEKITVRHLLTHRAGVERGIADAADRLDEVLAFYKGAKTLPLTMADVAMYQATRPLLFEPGTEKQYSNLGFLFLAWLVERKRGNYVDAVRQHIFAPCGIPVDRPKITGTPFVPLEAVAFDREMRIGKSVLTPNRPITPIEYGTLNFDISAGAGGWSFAPADYVRFLSRLFDGSNTLLDEKDLDELDPEELQEIREHGGGLVGAETYARHFEHQGSRMAYAIFYNRDVPGDFDRHIRDVITALPSTAWPSHDLFPVT